MQAILKQRNFLKSQIFEITDSSLLVKIKKPFNYFEGEFTFEELSTRTEKRRKPDVVSIIGSVVMLFVTFVFLVNYFTNSKEFPIYEFLICFGVFIIFVLFALASHENVIKLFLTGNRFISFFASSPNKQTVSDFLLVLRERQKTYLLERYAKADPYLAPDRLLANLDWLWEINLIDTTELGNLRKAIVPRAQNEANIGFKFGNN